MLEKQDDLVHGLPLCHSTDQSEKKSINNFPRRSKEEKAAEKDRLAVVQDEYGFCMMDGHKQKVANFRCTHLQCLAINF